MNNPVHYFDPAVDKTEDDRDVVKGWYFWDETWATRHGPYNTMEDADQALARYCDEL